jgi:hypothetical protein
VEVRRAHEGRARREGLASLGWHVTVDVQHALGDGHGAEVRHVPRVRLGPVVLVDGDAGVLRQLLDDGRIRGGHHDPRVHGARLQHLLRVARARVHAFDGRRAVGLEQDRRYGVGAAPLLPSRQTMAGEH